MTEISITIGMTDFNSFEKTDVNFSDWVALFLYFIEKYNIPKKTKDIVSIEVNSVKLVIWEWIILSLFNTMYLVDTYFIYFFHYRLISSNLIVIKFHLNVSSRSKLSVHVSPIINKIKMFLQKTRGLYVIYIMYYFIYKKTSYTSYT